MLNMTLFWGITITAATMLTGVLLIWLGWRGKRLDDHPLCRKCGYDLSGSVGDDGTKAEACPECGAKLATRRAVSLGNRRRRPRMIVIGVAMLIVCMFGSSGGGYVVYQASLKPANRPTWLLVIQARWHDTRVLDALVDRGHMGMLSASDYQALTPTVLRIQGDGQKVWDKRWGDLFEQAMAAGHTSDADVERYARNIIDHVVKLEMRDRARRGIKFTVGKAYGHPRVAHGSDLALYYEHQEFGLGPVTKPPPTWPKRAQEMRLGRNTHNGELGGYVDAYEFTPAEWAQIPSGPVLFWQDIDLAIRQGPKNRRKTLYYTKHRMEQTIEIVPRDQVVVPAVTDAGYETRVKRAVKLTAARMKPRWKAPGQQLELSFQFRPVLVGQAYDVMVDDGHGNEKVMTFRLDPNRAMDWGMTAFGQHDWPGRALRSGTITVTLRPSRMVAYRDADLKSYWGKPIVFENVEVDNWVEPGPTD